MRLGPEQPILFSKTNKERRPVGEQEAVNPPKSIQLPSAK